MEGRMTEPSNPQNAPSRWRSLAAELIGRRAGRREVVDVLVATMDARHVVTCEHVKRVAIYSAGLGMRLGLSRPEIDALRVAALLHDVGKVAVPDAILLKPGKLTPEEFDVMKLHPITGEEILRGASFRLPVLPLVRSHHERWDGRGYPDQLRGDQISISVQILALCDFYDALREDRSYRPAMPRHQAIELVQGGNGTHFSPQLVGAFMRALPELERAVALAEESQPARKREQLSVTSREIAPAAGYASDG
jgi:putative nucleotidyltransferase with HDIG domain